MNRLIIIAGFICILFPEGCRHGTVSRKEGPLPAVPGNNSEAKRFSLQKTDSCRILKIFDPWQGAEGIMQVYYLVKQDQELPRSIDSLSVIHVPVRRIICMSTTYLAMMKALGKEEAIVGVSGANFVYDDNILKKIGDGTIVDVGYEAGINNELIINTAPDLVMAYGVGSESAGYVSKIKELGIRVMFNADYLEENALAKAEWIKVFGALFCMENLADSIYGSLSRSYYSMKSYISSHIKVKPHVLLGMPFRDTWFISPGNSFAARFIEDAGGDYLWKDTFSSSSIPLSLENVYFKAIEADYWLNTGALTKKDEIASLDPRLLELKCYQTGNIYNNNKRMSPGGGNDYWESGTINPHVILKDIASILHPGLFGDYEPVYYRKIK